MLEDIRRQCMERNEKRYVIAGRLKTRFTFRAHAEIEKMIDGSQFCERWMARHNRHEVRLGNGTFSVDMNARTCGCMKWQMTGIPCVHAASVIIGKKEKVPDYVSHWYTTQTWRQTYEDGIAPVQGDEVWPPTNRLAVLPPPCRRGNPGRPNNFDRRKSMYENASSSSSSKTKLSRAHRVMSCSNCKEEGHNKQGCQNARVATPPRRPRGRPRLNQEPRIVFFGQGQSFQGQSSQEPTLSQPSVSQPSQPPVSEPQVSEPPLRGEASQRGRGGGQRGRGSTGPGGEGWNSWFECST